MQNELKWTNEKITVSGLDVCNGLEKTLKDNYQPLLEKVAK